MQDNKDVILRLIGAINTRELDVFDEVAVPELQISGTTASSSLADLKREVGEFLVGFPDLYITLNQIVAEGDWVVTGVTNRGTHTGSFQGLAPTGRRIEFDEVELFRLVEGKIVQMHSLVDQLGLMQQLGLVAS